MSDDSGAETRQVTWKIEGPAVEGGIAVDHVVRVLNALQGAVRRMAEVIVDEGKGRRRGPPKKSIASDISLRLVKTRRGSFSATLELPRVGDQKQLWHTGQEALDQLLLSLEQLSEGIEPTALPQAVVPDVENLLAVVGDGVTKLTFRGKPKGIAHVASFREQRKVKAARPASTEYGSLSGRLREVDFKDHTAELYDAAGRMTKVRFARDQEEDLRRTANRQVVIEGDIENDPATLRTSIRATEIQPIDTDDSFWTTARLSELAEKQGVRQLNDKSLRPVDFWPGDLSPEEFLAPIQQERQQNR